MKLKVLLPLFFICIIALFGAIEYRGHMADSSIINDKAKKSTIKNETVLQDATSHQEAIQVIHDFYKTYIEATLRSDRSLESALIKKYLTNSLMEKVRRMGSVTGANPIIRAQDVNEHMLETLDVKHLKDNWYMIEYSWDDQHQINIPLRIEKTNGQYLIDYITPEWHGSIYGDHLLLSEPIIESIDTTDPLSLLKTFYAIYTSEYCILQDGLGARLDALRNAYFSSNALAQFELSADEKKLDGNHNYDLLIDDFDFDLLWMGTMSIKQVNSKTYEMSYRKSTDLVTAVSLSVIKSDGEFKIDNIQIAKTN